MPEMRGHNTLITLLGEGDKLRRVRVDGFHNLNTSDVDEYYLLCLECGKILFNNMEAADKFLKGTADNGGRNMPGKRVGREAPHNTPTFYFPLLSGKNPRDKGGIERERLVRRPSRESST
jgi:hypothetical protein